LSTFLVVFAKSSRDFEFFILFFAKYMASIVVILAIMLYNNRVIILWRIR